MLYEERFNRSRELAGRTDGFVDGKYVKAALKRADDEPKDEPQTETSTNAEKVQLTDYERGRQDAWDIAQKVFDSTVTLYEAEDVAKQIDKDEQQTDLLVKTPHKSRDSHEKDTPQTEIKTGCSRCEAKGRCRDADSEGARWCNNYNKDTQTDCVWK
jgi:hypothetical protein